VEISRRGSCLFEKGWCVGTAHIMMSPVERLCKKWVAVWNCEPGVFVCWVSSLIKILRRVLHKDISAMERSLWVLIGASGPHAYGLSSDAASRRVLCFLVDLIFWPGLLPESMVVKSTYSQLASQLWSDPFVRRSDQIHVACPATMQAEGRCAFRRT
jgi:hypothetical protein